MKSLSLRQTAGRKEIIRFTARRIMVKNMQSEGQAVILKESKQQEGRGEN